MSKLVTITFHEELNFDTYLEFEEGLNSARIRGREVILYLSTPGGEMALAENMIDLINSYPYKITIKCNGWLFSAGLYIVNKVTVPVEVSDNCVGLIHIPSIALESRGQKKKTGFESYMVENEQQMINDYLDGMRHILSEKEIELVIEGEDVCIGKDKIMLLLKGAIDG